MTPRTLRRGFLVVTAAVILAAVGLGGAAAARYSDQSEPARVVTCERDVPPPPPGYPGHNPAMTSIRWVFPATGQCPTVPDDWSPWTGRTACQWSPAARRWDCP